MKIFDFDKKRLEKKADAILKLDSRFSEMSDTELAGKTEDFRFRLSNGETLDDILVEAFATVREAAWRTLGMKHFRVQLIGGIVLHEGRIAEMKTGEGKTLTETLPAYLNALTGKGVHIVTVNEYLAERDMNLMKPVYEFLGLTCDAAISSKQYYEKQKSYLADITYSTNNELGFDFLRDSLSKNPNQIYQRELNFAIVDEVDSILIDEARTPLVLNQEKKGTSKHHEIVWGFVNSLKEEDIIIEEEDRYVGLTDSGMNKAENFFGLKNYTEDNPFIHYINQSLKARCLMRRDRDYTVMNGEVVIVDEFTGRLGIGRRFSKGLHEAIEAKEGVQVKDETATLATITYQNFFREYNKLSGMTGTAKTEEKEFMEIYGLDVVQIPTNKPLIRIDHDDKVFFNKKAKLKGILEEILTSYEKKQPVLVGTTSIEASEELASLLRENDIPHNLLNAKNHEEEASIISMAGHAGQVTISTNMAGRGTDIILGDGVKELGGLKVIGTERHDSRRIDNQLIGRSGRQGDPGESIFYLSLEDDLIRLFGGDKIELFLMAKGFNEDIPIKSSFITKQINNAQKIVEGNNYDARKNTIDFDDVLNRQRKVIYEERNILMRDEVNIADLLEKYGIENAPVYDAAFINTVRLNMLKIIDMLWIQHVDEMMDLKQDAYNKTYQGLDPIAYYIMESSKMFDEMIENIKEKTSVLVEVIKEHIKNTENRS